MPIIRRGPAVFVSASRSRLALSGSTACETDHTRIDHASKHHGNISITVLAPFFGQGIFDVVRRYYGYPGIFSEAITGRDMGRIHA